MWAGSGRGARGRGRWGCRPGPSTLSRGSLERGHGVPTCVEGCPVDASPRGHRAGADPGYLATKNRGPANRLRPVLAATSLAAHPEQPGASDRTLRVQVASSQRHLSRSVSHRSAEPGRHRALLIRARARAGLRFSVMAAALQRERGSLRRGLWRVRQRQSCGQPSVSGACGAPSFASSSSRITRRSVASTLSGSLASRPRRTSSPRDRPDAATLVASSSLR